MVLKEVWFRTPWTSLAEEARRVRSRGGVGGPDLPGQEQNVKRNPLTRSLGSDHDKFSEGSEREEWRRQRVWLSEPSKFEHHRDAVARMPH